MAVIYRYLGPTKLDRVGLDQGLIQDISIIRLDIFAPSLSIQCNLDYSDFDYPDFSIIRILLVGPTVWGIVARNISQDFDYPDCRLSGLI